MSMPHMPLTAAVVVCVTVWAIIYLGAAVAAESESARRALARFSAPRKLVLRALLYGPYLASVLLLCAGMIVGINPMVSFGCVIVMLVLAVDLSRHPV